VRTNILLVYLPFRSCSLDRVGRSLRCILLILDAALKSSSRRSTLEWSRRNPFRSLSVRSRSPYVYRSLQCSLDSRFDAPLSLSSLGSLSISDGGTSLPLSLCLLKINKLKTRRPVRAGVRTLGISGEPLAGRSSDRLDGGVPEKTRDASDPLRSRHLFPIRQPSQFASPLP
jgi:hypothetical protein